MGMVVRTNIMAINANRQLGMNSSAVTKSLEKLSSGFKINRAGDDASGLAISEKMKAQIKGLETASANSQDGISLVQTAEGALTEVHDMLNRMVELATKSANGTIQNEVDRENIQNEVNALLEEIDRIGDSTNFNGINLIDGSLGGGSSSAAAGVPAIKGLTLTDTAATNTKSSFALNTITGTLTDGSKLNYSFTTDTGVSVELEFTVDATNKKLIAADGTEYSIAAADGKATDAEQASAIIDQLGKTKFADLFDMTAASGGIDFTAKTAGTSGAKVVAGTAPVAAGTAGNNTAATITAGADAYQSHQFAAGDIGKIFTIGGKQFVFANKADVANYDSNVTVLQVATDGQIGQTDLEKMAALIEQKTGYKPTVNGTDTFDFKASTGTKVTSGKGLTLQIGDTSDEFNKVTVSVGNMKADGLGIAGLDVSTQDAAGSAIDVIRNAINNVSKTRGDLGALQNRLEHTINNLDVAAENMTSANSRIRDTDMAKEMMNYTKLNVLTQAAQAMLAQANQQPQSILQLLQ